MFGKPKRGIRCGLEYQACHLELVRLLGGNLSLLGLIARLVIWASGGIYRYWVELRRLGPALSWLELARTSSLACFEHFCFSCPLPSHRKRSSQQWHAGPLRSLCTTPVAACSDSTQEQISQQRQCAAMLRSRIPHAFQFGISRPGLEALARQRFLSFRLRPARSCRSERSGEPEFEESRNPRTLDSSSRSLS